MILHGFVSPGGLRGWIWVAGHHQGPRQLTLKTCSPAYLACFLDESNNNLFEIYIYFGDFLSSQCPTPSLCSSHSLCLECSSFPLCHFLITQLIPTQPSKFSSIPQGSFPWFEPFPAYLISQVPQIEGNNTHWSLLEVGGWEKEEEWGK